MIKYDFISHAGPCTAFTPGLQVDSSDNASKSMSGWAACITNTAQSRPSNS